MIKIILPGDPIPQGRMRLFKRGNKVMIYDPQTAFKKDLKRQVMDQMEELD